MTFKDLMEKYKAGSTTSEERQLVESEIEKSEAINDYLSDQIMDAIPEIKNRASSDEKSNAKKIKRTMNRKFRNVVITSVAAVVALFCIVQFAVFPIINNSYYNPLEGRHNVIGVTEWGQMSIDMSVFSELHLKGYETPFVLAKPEGLGSYDLTLYQYDAFRNYSETQYRSQLIRGKLDNAMSDNALISGMSFNWLQSAYGSYTDMDKVSTVDGVSRAELSQLPESAQVKAYLFFNETIDMQALAELVKQGDVRVLWAGIKCSDDDTMWSGRFGFSPQGKYIPLIGNAYDAQLYPLLELDESEPWGGADVIDFTKLTATTYETHFKSLLKYMAEKKDFMEVIGFDYDYSSALSYVQNNGIGCFGVVVSGSRDAIEAISSTPAVQYIAVDDVMVSIYSK